MISEKVINAILKNASYDDLKNFAKVVISSILNRESWNDAKLNLCLELIAGNTPYVEKDFEKVDLKEVLRKYGYRQDCDIIDANLVYIDNFENTVRIEYSIQKEGEESPSVYNTDVSISQILQS